MLFEAWYLVWCVSLRESRAEKVIDRIFGREWNLNRMRVRVRETEREGNLMMILSLLIGGISLTLIRWLLQQPLIHCYSHSSLSSFYCQLSLTFNSISFFLFTLFLLFSFPLCPFILFLSPYFLYFILLYFAFLYLILFYFSAMDFVYAGTASRPLMWVSVYRSAI